MAIGAADATDQRGGIARQARSPYRVSGVTRPLESRTRRRRPARGRASRGTAVRSQQSVALASAETREENA